MEGENPSTRKRGFSPSKPPTFPSTAWGCRPKTPRFFSHSTFFCFGSAPKASRGAFPCFGSAPVASPACFQPLGVLPRLSRRVFSLWECSQGFPRAILSFGSAPKASPAHFRPLGALPRLPRRVFSLWECSQGFPRAILSFGSIPKASPAHFRPLGAFPLLSRRIFSLWERSCGKLAGFRECARIFTSALSARGAEIIQNHFIRRMNHGTDNSCKGERQGAHHGA